MKRPNYFSGQKVILTTYAQGLHEGQELTIISHSNDDEYDWAFYSRNLIDIKMIEMQCDAF